MVVRSNVISGTGLCPPSTSGSATLGIEEWGACHEALVEDNTLDHWLSISGSSYAAVRRNTVAYPTGPVIGYIGLEMVYGTNCLFTDNLVNGGQQIGISISGGPNTYLYWCSNTIEHMMSWAVQDQGPCYGHYFYGNQFLYTQSSTNSLYPTDAGSGFRINANCTNITLESNLIQSNAAAAIEFLEPLLQLSFVGNTITSNSAVENYSAPDTLDLLWTNNVVSNNRNNVVPLSRGFTADPMPIAAFTAPSTVSVGQPISFTNLSTAPGSAIANNLWDLGAGIPLTVSNPGYTYTMPGVYRVSLLVWNTQGRCARAQAFVNVTVPPPILSNPVYRNNQLVFEVGGATNYSYIMQSSTDLVAWVNLQTNAAPFRFTNSITAQPMRFYRGVF
jgi:hypothetical protein